MKLRDFRIGWRLLARQPGYSAVIVLGLAVGFAACFLLLALVRYAYTYNDAIAGARQIYLVKEMNNVLPLPDWQPIATLDLARAARKSGLPVSATSAKSYDVAVQRDSRPQPLTVQVADQDYLAFFGIRALEGDAAAALARPGGIALSRETAARVLGDTHALGKVVRVAGQAYEVRAILPDLPANTSVDIDALIGPGHHPFAAERPTPFTRGSVYVKAPPGLDQGALLEVLQDVLAAYSVERRSREIVLRKLHGARGRDISWLVAREFGLLVAIGALAGLPLAWLGIERYLASFVERAPMGQIPLLFAFALIAVAGVAATACQTLRAARMSPALALKD